MNQKVVNRKNSSKKSTRRIPKGKNLSGIHRLIASSAFKKAYVVLSLATLFSTTIYWSILSATLQQKNADQLVDVFLFESAKTFHNAVFPSVHSMLLKWPIFAFINRLGSSNVVFITFTVGLVVATVATLVVVLYQIDRRLLMFGTLCFALASVLTLVPTQPYAGALLPVNMAMLTTRNLEYVLYIFSLVLLIRTRHLKSWRFWLATACLTLLIASDTLFLALSLGGALVALVVFAHIRRWSIVSLAVNWLIAGMIATVSAMLLVHILGAAGVTHFVNQTGVASPYGLVQNSKSLVLGSFYAGLNLLTNFGANPAFDATQVHTIVAQAKLHLSSIGGLSFIINISLLFVGIYAIYCLLRTTFVRKKDNEKIIDGPYRLSIMLICSTLVAVGAFITTSHYYLVDARYLTIALFAVFVSATTYLRTRRWPSEKIIVAGGIILVGIVLGLPAFHHIYTTDTAALSTVSQRNSTIVDALARHPVDQLVGDYWRVIPTKSKSNNQLVVLPLANCFQARDTLSSSSWQLELHKHSFAYLLSFDQSLTDYPSCTLNQVVATYGRPNSSALVDGTLSKPKELLLFYDRGINNSAPASKPLTPSPETVTPTTLDNLPYTNCPVPTTMTIVAHQDDDLLFINPNIIHDIQAGYCVRTVYITAGDAGTGKFYWLSREHGSEAAYANMIGTSNVWIERIVQLSNNEFITIANPKGNSKVSLIFFHLPDGNLQGQGFKATNYESLARLSTNNIKLIHSVDEQSSYSSSQFINALVSLMIAYQPTKIYTQANYISKQYPDHSDHMAVGRFVKNAYQAYETQQYAGQITIPISFFIGYPVHAMPVNVTGKDFAEKSAAYFNYAKFDGDACQTEDQCRNGSTFSLYLARQYTNLY